MSKEYDEDYIAYVEEQEALKKEEEYLENQMQLEVKARQQREKEIELYEKNWY